jgi:hypothetical protein
MQAFRSFLVGTYTQCYTRLHRQALCCVVCMCYVCISLFFAVGTNSGGVFGHCSSGLHGCDHWLLRLFCCACCTHTHIFPPQSVFLSHQSALFRGHPLPVKWLACCGCVAGASVLRFFVFCATIHACQDLHVNQSHLLLSHALHSYLFFVSREGHCCRGDAPPSIHTCARPCTIPFPHTTLPYICQAPYAWRETLEPGVKLLRGLSCPLLTLLTLLSSLLSHLSPVQQS